MSNEFSWSEAPNEVDDNLPVVASDNNCKPKGSSPVFERASSNSVKSPFNDSSPQSPSPIESTPAKADSSSSINSKGANKNVKSKGLKERLLNALLFAFTLSFIGVLAYAWIILPILIAIMAFISPSGLDTESALNVMLPLGAICAVVGALVGLFDINVSKQASGLISTLAIGFGAVIGGIALTLVVAAITGGNCPDAVAATALIAGALAGGYLGFRITRK